MARRWGGAVHFRAELRAVRILPLIECTGYALSVVEGGLPVLTTIARKPTSSLSASLPWQSSPLASAGWPPGNRSRRFRILLGTGADHRRRLRSDVVPRSVPPTAPFKEGFVGQDDHPPSPRMLSLYWAFPCLVLEYGPSG